jgi:hypothetical protein
MATHANIKLPRMRTISDIKRNRNPPEGRKPRNQYVNKNSKEPSNMPIGITQNFQVCPDQDNAESLGIMQPSSMRSHYNSEIISSAHPSVNQI